MHEVGPVVCDYIKIGQNGNENEKVWYGLFAGIS